MMVSGQNNDEDSVAGAGLFGFQTCEGDPLEKTTKTRPSTFYSKTDPGDGSQKESLQDTEMNIKMKFLENISMAQI